MLIGHELVEKKGLQKPWWPASAVPLTLPHRLHLELHASTCTMTNDATATGAFREVSERAGGPLSRALSSHYPFPDLEYTPSCRGRIPTAALRQVPRLRSPPPSSTNHSATTMLILTETTNTKTVAMTMTTTTKTRYVHFAPTAALHTRRSIPRAAHAAIAHGSRGRDVVTH